MRDYRKDSKPVNPEPESVNPKLPDSVTLNKDIFTMTREERKARYFQVFPPDEMAQLIKSGMTLGDARVTVYNRRDDATE